MANTAHLPKHDIRKYQDVVKLTDSNWIDWKDVIETVLVNRGLWRITSRDEGLLLDSRPPQGGSGTLSPRDHWGGGVVRRLSKKVMG
jgi:hypothetical protein